jgi:hypothetical protein
MKSLKVWLVLAACAGGVGLAAVQTAAAQTVTAASLAGEWKGTLGGQLPLVLHLSVDATGMLTASMDSPAQGASNLAGANAKLAGTTLSYDIPSVGGNYSGTVSADGKSIAGTWTQNGRALPLEWTFTASAADAAAEAAAVKPSPIDGDWTGALSAGGQTLHLVFHFKTAPDGIVCSIVSVDQTPQPIPCGNVKVDGRRVTLSSPVIQATYDGKLRADGKHMDGTWTQGSSKELDLTKK